MSIEQTLCMIKPDAVRAGNVPSIISIIAEYNLKIVNTVERHLTTEDVKEFYSEHVGKDFFQEHANFMTSGPVVAMVLEGPDAIKVWRGIMGNTDPEKADWWTLRHCFGTKLPYNAVHGSDSISSAKREIDFFFNHTI